MTNLNQLAWFKKQALAAGDKGIMFSVFRNNSGLWKTDYPGGNYMEIVISWMFGYFRTASRNYLWVDMSGKLDSEGVDFKISSHAKTVFINMKFDKDKESDTCDLDHRYECVRTWVDPDASSSVSKNRQTGVEALTSMLRFVYPERYIDFTIKSNAKMEEELNHVWRICSRNW